MKYDATSKERMNYISNLMKLTKLQRRVAGLCFPELLEDFYEREYAAEEIQEMYDMADRNYDRREAAEKEGR